MSASPEETVPASSWAGRQLRAFGRFWWDFLVGETPELLVGAVLVVGAVALVHHGGVARSVTEVALPALVITLLALSLIRAKRTGRH